MVPDDLYQGKLCKTRNLLLKPSDFHDPFLLASACLFETLAIAGALYYDSEPTKILGFVWGFGGVFSTSVLTLSEFFPDFLLLYCINSEHPEETV